MGIGPHVAQSILDNTEIALPNLTQAACPQNYTWLFNSARIKVPGIGPIKLASTLEEYTQETWTTACVQGGFLASGATCGENATEYMMGSYKSPSMTVSPGDNYQNFTVTMNSNATTILSAWVLPLWLAGQKARLILKAKDIKVKVMGITFSGLTMRNEMVCTGVPGTPSITIPNRVCYPNDPKHERYETQEYHAICEAGHGSLAPATTTTTPVKPAPVIA